MTDTLKRFLGAMVLMRAIEKVLEQNRRSYPAPHCGRPGEKGGSLPREECATLKEEEEKVGAPSPGSATEAATQKYSSAVEAEPALTKLVQRLTGETGGKLHAPEHRLKSEASLARRIASDMAEKDVTAQVAADTISDHVRYTTLFEADEFVSSVLDTQQRLEAEGWTKYDHKWKNFWPPGDAYDGYNTVYVHGETGQRFEWQFHTPESIVIKDNGHKLYEKVRVMKRGPARTVLLRQMTAMWEVAYDKPQQWEKLPGILIGRGR